MTGPDYSKYSKNELLEALSSIDKNLYPERVKNIKSELENRNPEDSEIKEETKPSVKLDFNKAKAFKDFILYFEKGSYFLDIFSFVFGIVILIAFSFKKLFLALGSEITINIPGLSAISNSFNKYFIIVIFVCLHLGLILGSLRKIFKKIIFDYLLAISWGLFAIDFQFGPFLWQTKITYDTPFGMYFNLFGINFEFGINLYCTFFFLWTVISVPELRRQLSV